MTRTAELLIAAGLACVTAIGTPVAAAEKGGADGGKKSPAAAVLKEISASGTARVIVTVRTRASASALGAAMADPSKRTAAKAEIASAIDKVAVTHFGIGKRMNGGAIVKLSTVPAFSVLVTKGQLERLLADPSVLSVRVDHRASKVLDTTTVTIGMPAAWSHYIAGSGRTAAVLDTGVQANHPFLGTSRVLGEACFTTDSTCNNSDVSDSGPGTSYPYNTGSSHGTHVSGITLGLNTVSGGAPKAGVAKYAKLIAANVFDSSGYTYESTMTQGLEWVESQDIAHPTWYIRAINMSIGGGIYGGYCDETTPAFFTVVNRLRARNIPLIVAAGNDSYPNAMSWPGCLSNVVSVGATNRAGTAVSYYSNLSSKTRVLAPGGDTNDDGAVISSVLGGLYEGYQGTSMAAPHVTGALAALRGGFPSTRLAYLEDALRRSGPLVTDGRYGTGQTLPRLNVEAARAFLAAPVAPTNDAFASAIPITTRFSEIFGSTSGATRQSGEPAPLSAQGPSAWWKVTPTATQKMSFSTFGSNFDTVLGVYTGNTVSSLTQVTANDNASSSTKSSQVTFWASVGKTYYLQVSGKAAADGGIIRLEGMSYPANDNFASARSVWVYDTAMTLATGNNYMATTEVNEPLTVQGNTVWWKFTAHLSGAYTIDTIGSMTTSGAGADTVLAVYTGTTLSGLTQIAYDDDSGLDLTSRLTFNATAGQTYLIQVGTFSKGNPLDAGPIRLNFTPPGFEYSSAMAKTKPRFVVDQQ
ncbi:S8 family peptidase [Pinisolibacter sp.]|uniref:S8 family peptidase n=1 Tax=Pinisolibacter sp. TaxID=2172024 RepID=UPI002FDEEDC1